MRITWVGAVSAVMVSCSQPQPPDAGVLPVADASVMVDGGVAAPTCVDGIKNGTETDLDCGGSACPACSFGRGCAAASDCQTAACVGSVCQPPGCTDGRQNGNETDVDCGGGCSLCAETKRCVAATDCSSQRCVGQRCVAAACDDGQKNGTESDVDCGGSTCAACEATRGCSGALDCASRVCSSRQCAASSCSDGQLNGAETDVDCGGSCGPCSVGKLCAAAADCTNGVCTNRVCQAATCADGARNGSETDTDCGGPACPACAATRRCVAPADCVARVCTQNVCAAAACSDSLRNGDESDVDCGGSCTGCAASQQCSRAADCASGVCTGSVCVAPSCTDGVRNGAELDIDCGGTCGPCGPLRACRVAADCSSSVCTNLVCQAPTCGDLTQNASESDVDCGGSCPKCAAPSRCMLADDCASGVCTMGRCVAGSCTDGVKNGTETGVDCGGACGACSAGAGCTTATDCVSGRCIAGQCNPDPSMYAPALVSGAPLDLASSTRFLYSGPTASQRGLDAGLIEPERVTVVRGTVLARDGAPLPDVTVSVAQHPEFGATTTRADGAFDLVLNGGGPVTLTFARIGYLTAQRQVFTRWRQFEVIAPVSLVTLDSKVTVVDLSSLTTVATAQGNPVSDGDGTRTTSVLFSPGTTATMHLPDGGLQPVTSLRVRSTEYTVGADGQRAMPGTLPASSGYTWAAELSIDEAIAAGAERVTFSQPVVVYVDNFLGFAVGTAVPVGYYDRTQARWSAMPNGRVVRVLSVTAGAADLDLDGSSMPAGPGPLAALGITLEERRALAAMSVVGKSLWRSTTDHFTPVDQNWPYTPPPGAGGPPKPPIKPPPKEGCPTGGSVVLCEDQSLGESIDLAGVPFALQYQSLRAPGRIDEFSVQLPVTGPTVPAGLVRVDVEAVIAGQRITRSFAPTPNQTFTFRWNGRDAYGRRVHGRLPMVGSTGFVYQAVYQSPGNFPRAFAEFSGVQLTSNRTREGGEVTLSTAWTRDVGAPAGPELGGWWLTPHHAYSKGDNAVFMGSGSTHALSSVSSIVTTVAGTGVPAFNGDGLPGPQTALSTPHMARMMRDGSILIVDFYNHRIRKVRTDGTVVTVAGNGTQGFGGDEGPAINATLDRPHTLALGPDDSIIFSEPFNRRIRKVTPDGIIHTIVGTGGQGSSGDNGPATLATVDTAYMLDVGPDGSVYFGDTLNNRVRKVTPDGIITTIAGTGAAGLSAEGIPATQSTVWGPTGIAVEPSGSILVSEYYGHRIRRIGTDGLIRTVVGTGTSGYSGDGAQALAARIDRPHQVNVARDGTIYLVHYLQDHVVRQVTPDGIITTIAGTGTLGLTPDGLPATRTAISGPHGVTPALDGSLLFAELNNQRIRKLSAPLAGSLQGDTVVPSPDGASVLVFDSLGRHLRTVDAVTGALQVRFGYDAAGRLSTLTDGAGNLTTIERSPTGAPEAIVAPGGQRTVLTVDANGFLSAVRNPAQETVLLEHSAEGLLTRLTDPRGNAHTYAYDSLGRLVRDTSPTGKQLSLSRSETATGALVTVTDALGASSTYSTDATGNRRVDDAFGGRWSTSSADNGTASRNRPDGTTETSTLDPDPRFGMQVPLTGSRVQRTPAGKTQTSSFTRAVTLSAAGDPTRLATLLDVETTNGRVLRRRYDAMTRTWTLESPAGRTSVEVLDAQGRTVSSINTVGATPMTTVYGAGGRVERIVRGAETTSFTYDATRRVATRTDPTGSVTAFTYDLADRVTSLTRPGNHVWQFGYDANGNRTSVTAPSGARTTMAYDAENRLSAFTPPGTSTPMTVVFDLAGRPVRQTLSGGRSLSRTYAISGLLLSTVSSESSVAVTTVAGTGQTASVTRIAAGQTQRLAFTWDGPLLTRMTSSGVATGDFQLRYDDDFRLVGLTFDSEPELVSVRDADGLVTTQGPFVITRLGPAGAPTRYTDGTLTLDVTYDAMGRERTRSFTIGGTERYREAVTYAPGGALATDSQTVLGTTREVSFTVDPLGQLTTVSVAGMPVEQYGYDVDGNRTSRTQGVAMELQTVDTRGLVSLRGSTTYGFNVDGQLATRGSDLFTVGIEGEVLSATVGGATVTYTIDGTGRRVARTDATGTTQYFYGTGHQNELTHSRDPAGVLTTYFFDDRGRVIAFKRGAVRYYVATDTTGQPKVVFDSTGAVVKRLTHDAFGRVLTDSAPTFKLEVGFAGGLRDELTGLVHLGARDYEPETGRFISRDPSLFGGAQGNLYAYGNNDPVSNVDRSGHGDMTRDALEMLVRDFTNKLSDEGRRIPELRLPGEVEGYVNNFISKTTPLPWEQCVGQSAEFMTRYGYDLAYQGFKFELFDQTKKTDTSGGVEHQFVKVTAPDGKQYQVDPWMNKVIPFDPKKFEGSKGVKETIRPIRPRKPQPPPCPKGR